MQLTQSEKDTLTDLIVGGRFAEAHLRAQALTHEYPAALDAWNMRGVAALKLGKIDDAQVSFCKLEELAPDLPGAPYNLGLLYEGQGADEQAIEAFARAVERAPNWWEAQSALGALYLRLGDTQKAYQHLKRAAQLQPASPKAQNNFGNALKRLGRLQEAHAAYTHAIKANPDFAAAHYNLGMLESESGNRERAAGAFRRVLEIEPDHALAKVMLLYELSLCCDWEAMAEHAGAAAKLGCEGTPVPPFVMLSLEDNPANQLKRARNWAKAQFGHIAEPERAFARPAKRPERLRIGYLGAHFHDHPGIRLMSSMLKSHDRSRFEVHAVSCGRPRGDEWRKVSKEVVDEFHDVHGWDDPAALSRLQALELDIVIDRQGYTANNRFGLLAHRIAPVQISYLGYPSTTAAPFIDYMVADRTIIPPEHRAYYDEPIIWLPDCYQPGNNTLTIAEPSGQRSDHGLPEDAFVLCCFNNLSKITREVFALWTKLLRQIEGSVLWLLAPDPAAQKNLRGAIEAEGIAPERLIFAPRIPHPNHLERHRHADLFLDTAPYGAHTTCNDALWAGLPVVTMMGEQMSARVAGSVLTAAGLPELITHSWKEYEALIAALASDKQRLEALRTKLAKQRAAAPMFDTALYTRRLEDGYDAAYARFLKGLPPADIEVANRIR